MNLNAKTATFLMRSMSNDQNLFNLNKIIMEPIFGMAIFFIFVYLMIKLIFDFVLRNKLIKQGHLDEAKVLQPQRSHELDLYPSLKWGLALFFGGAGLLILEFIKPYYPQFRSHDSLAPFGIVLTSTALGFLIYFVIVAIKSKGKENIHP